MNLKHLTFNKIFLDEVDSTNSFLIDFNQTNKQVEGTIVISNHQLKGKGQRGSNWLTEKGQNLTFSILIYPQLNVRYSFYLNIISALSVNKTLKDLNLASKIKWPNDILIQQNKIAGILVENVISSSIITQSVIGIGLNVNQHIFTDKLNATSIKKEGITIDKNDVLNQIYQYFDFYYDLLIQSNFELLLKLYYKELLWYKETGHFIDLKFNQRFAGQLEGINNDGKLKIKDLSNQQIKLYDLKEVSFVL